MIMMPLETQYAGCDFRSRLEARWAVFFDVWGLKWRYEPDAFLLPSGRAYLPDFFIDGIGYIECKPSREADDGKLSELAGMLFPQDMHGYLICTEVPAPSEICEAGPIWSIKHDYIVHGLDDVGYWFTQCERCGKKDITYSGMSGRVRCHCKKAKADRDYNEQAVTQIKVAAVAARSHRF